MSKMNELDVQNNNQNMAISFILSFVSVKSSNYCPKNPQIGKYPHLQFCESNLD